ncbi:unnamed protein product [Prorocentrum cordatum]|uniref:Uncharacterized protein n=1 Tax=Prorocentrum cordatum TaxID=2364126 RepID=A0ABN9SGT9_9DINO|nr:unnamed protein product [Polarella glacialis]
MAAALGGQYLLGGREVHVRYSDETCWWHRRVVMCRCPLEVYRRVMGGEPYTDTDAMYWTMTPYFDVHPEELTVPPLMGIVGTTPNGTLLPGSAIDRTSHLNLVHASPPLPTPAAFAEALRACLREVAQGGGAADHGIVPAELPLALPERSPQDQAVFDVVKGVCLASGLVHLPPATGGWRRVSGSGLSDADFDTDAKDKYLYAPGVALVSRNGELAVLVDCAERAAVASPELDARIFEISRDKLGKRHKDVKEAIDCCTVSAWDSCPLTGPRTVMWYLTFVVHATVSPEPGVFYHEIAMKATECMLTHDQSNAPKLVFAELFLRKAQLAEFRESTVAKERRKLPEERQLARASPALVPSQSAAAAIVAGANPLRSLTGAPANPKSMATAKGEGGKATAGPTAAPEA